MNYLMSQLSLEALPPNALTFWVCALVVAKNFAPMIHSQNIKDKSIPMVVYLPTISVLFFS